MSRDLNQYCFFQPPSGSFGNHSGVSCLTINQPGSRLALNNLLDVISHEIRQEDNENVHRLTFKSGQTLCIKVGANLITVRGPRISFHSDARHPQVTYLEDPALSNSGNKMSL
ncbi:hypothetical protein [Pseudomonas asplenii]|uniref:Uncharacterized protein n=1 Tax=Pseudomonas asplenii TaxID=53407 RepID=A0A1H6LS56_9PSED|nr:hypothetical protein [Pseudomonas fuscovaginae]SEH88302.1 hypothetical protein SAMN05216581_0308 [Pseudomonas fuscovaginae]